MALQCDGCMFWHHITYDKVKDDVYAFLACVEGAVKIKETRKKLKRIGTRKALVFVESDLRI